MLDAAFTGFSALPPAGHVKPWREVLGMPLAPGHVTLEQVEAQFKVMAFIHHPDRGGTHDQMAALNAALAAARKEFAEA